MKSTAMQKSAGLATSFAPIWRRSDRDLANAYCIAMSRVRPICEKRPKARIFQTLSEESTNREG